MDFSTIRAFIFDMDGVLWRDDQPIGNLPAIFARINDRGWKVTLATNNATLSVEQYLKKLKRLGVTLEAEQIVNSAQAAGHYLSSRFPLGGSIYIIGEEGLLQTLRDYGFQQAEEHVLAVVAGLDRQLTYEKLSKATQMIRSGALFIGTNPDRTFPTPSGLIPGAGAIVVALEAASDVKPIIVGKPSPEMYCVALERMGTTAADTLVVGDRLETDIAGAQNIGCLSALVLSGVSTLEAAQSWKPSPDWIGPDLTALIEQL